MIILGTVPPLDSPDLLPTAYPPLAYPKESLLARYAFSQALSRSTALAALEDSLDDFLMSNSAITASLEKTGKPGLNRTEVIKKLGGLMKFRQGLNLNRENFSDTPDFYWAEPELEGRLNKLSHVPIFALLNVASAYFNSISLALEVKARTNSVNDKITYAAEVQSVLRQLLTEVTWTSCSYAFTHSCSIVLDS